MRGMFEGSTFNGDITQWNVSSVTDMSVMFASASFNQDINQWNVSNVTALCGLCSGALILMVISASGIHLM